MTGRQLFELFRPLLIVLAFICRILPVSFRAFLWRVLDLFPGHLGNGLRWVLLKSLAGSCGDNVFVGTHVHIISWHNLHIGKNVSIHRGCYLDAEESIRIGDEVSIAHDCSFITFEHTWNDLSQPIKYNPTTKAPIHIASDVWLGCAVRVLSGVKVGQRSVIAAGSVVTKDVAAFTLVGGVPAKILKDLPQK